MRIKTKSLQSKLTKKDGLRVFVMRRIKPEFKFDVWIPCLAPPEKLLKDYVINKKITWSIFKKRFQKNVIEKNKKILRILIQASNIMPVTLLCWEKYEKKCHRSILLTECKKLIAK